MKKRIYCALAAVALLMTGVSAIGTAWWYFDEPNALESMMD